MLRMKLFCGVLIICFTLISVGKTQQVPGDDNNNVAGKNKIISDEPVFAVPGFDLNENALQFAEEYVKENNWGLANIKKRSRSRLHIINTIFTKYDIPVELKYMAIVESNLIADAVANSSGATGIWQLMPATASELGLTVTDDVDERLHVNKSSVAAAKYLKRLYAEFGDWLLVIAAYNSGPGKVTRAIELSGSDNFWQLQHYLPIETRNHVKRFVSVMYYFEEQNHSAPQQNSL